MSLIDNSHFSLRRVKALCLKETYQIIRDPSCLLIAVVIPILLLLIFGYGINLDSGRLNLGILVKQQDKETSQFVNSFANSGYVNPLISDNKQLLISALEYGNIRGIIIVPDDFSQSLNRLGGKAIIQVITDGSEPNTANFVQVYVNSIWQTWQLQRAEDKGLKIEFPINISVRYWFNPTTVSRNFIIPGAITIIITVIGALLTSLVIAREWERGTMDQLLVSPLTTGEILIGKAVPAIIIALMQATIILIVWCLYL